MSTAIARDRLARLLGLIGSAHDAHAERIRRTTANMNWHDTVVPALQEPTRHRELEGDNNGIEFCLECGAITDWGLRFLLSVQRHRYPPTPKQRVVPASIVDEARRVDEMAS
jgi:hypothetical protein